MVSYLKIKSTRDIPNVEGFSFLSIDNDGRLSLKYVLKNNITGAYYVPGFGSIIGWLPLENNEIVLRRKND